MASEIELADLVIPEVPATPSVLIKDGFARLTAGEHKKFMIKLAGDTVLDVSVPANKQWNIEIKVRIRETDA